jgi:hypothetical protein
MRAQLMSRLFRQMTCTGFSAGLIGISFLAISLGSPVQGQPRCGDTNNDGRVNIRDVCYLVNYVWHGGPPPSPEEVGDVNSDGGVNVGDQNWLFRSMTEPDYPLIACPPLRESRDGDLPPRGDNIESAIVARGRDRLPYGDFIDIDVVREGTTVAVETLYVGGRYEIRVWIENAAELFGLSMGFFVWSGDGVDWSWNPQSWGLPPDGSVTIKDSGRLAWPCNLGIASSVWDNPNPGTEIGFCGNALTSGLPPGPLEHMVSLHFRVDSLRNEGERTINIDSILWGRYDGDLVYSYQDGGGIYPQALWPMGGHHWPVIIPPCGDANSDGTVNVGDAVFLINYVFKGGAAPTPGCVGDANGDENANVGDAVYLINFVFKGGPGPAAGCCAQAPLIN